MVLLPRAAPPTKVLNAIQDHNATEASESVDSSQVSCEADYVPSVHFEENKVLLGTPGSEYPLEGDSGKKLVHPLDRADYRGGLRALFEAMAMLVGVAA